MKRKELIRYLKDQGCTLVREGAKHSIFINQILLRSSSVPRHTEINDFLVRKICKDLGIKDKT
ncbi:type II toxin-antitoxin system HicA family toxin [Candidatus Uhrbacteria bacterium]|nr:type II toxin-antitoxin system HicA family toxin [Candidatus Uhrbacteria bacterium]